jgi:hypothetical protein
MICESGCGMWLAMCYTSVVYVDMRMSSASFAFGGWCTVGFCFRMQCVLPAVYAYIVQRLVRGSCVVNGLHVPI